ncbi:MAG TPA: hypothetical protein VLE70_22395, partial [Anaerolineae bacterium]|nr:hypothetical protein [Anaerolineae bacterium]
MKRLTIIDPFQVDCIAVRIDDRFGLLDHRANEIVANERLLRSLFPIAPFVHPTLWGHSILQQGFTAARNS